MEQNSAIVGRGKAMRARFVALALLAACACGDGGGDDDDGAQGASCADPAVAAGEPLCALDQAGVRCEFVNGERCLLPYPSSYFLTPDPTTVTGWRVDYPRQIMPVNVNGVRIDPAEWSTLDGFSPGPILIASFPQGIDLAASGTAPVNRVERSLEADSPTVLIDAGTGERVLHFAELDVQAPDDARRAFLIRPAIRLREATRYVVAIRGLVDPAGRPVAAQRPFAILRDRLSTPVAAIENRREHFEEIFSVLRRAGVERNELILAWDFVTASTESITTRALATRDRGLAANGPGAPPFQVTSVEDEFSERIFRRVRGTYTVPLFMRDARPPTSFNLGADGLPAQNGTAEAPFTVVIPRVAVEGGAPRRARPIVYGHGLLGSGEGEVTARNLQMLANRFNFVLAATNWIGMSGEDVGPIVQMIGDFSNFRILPDRLQQAMLNFILLGRLMTAPDGFNSHPAFQFDGVPIIDTHELYYYGISQGGIEGGAYMALAPHTVRGVLGVPAANYSLLLQRSIDFNTFQLVFNANYLDPLDRAVIYPLLQQLWDRAEPQGYLSHLVADPLPGTPAKKILIQMGVNDSQVPDLGTGIQVRSLGIANLAPTVFPLFGVEEREGPFDGSALAAYDVNGTAPPLTNTPPDSENGVHGAVRLLDAAQLQIDAFLRPDGKVINFCGGPCFFTGVPGVEER